ncbi:Glycoside hydrolase family 29 protein [Pyrenophora tritici-repentis]|nr:Glycoside hydrolase family 29 protein [Pyrenophora tritici-repentis]KAI2478271.1 Glycoside hydrolase family 29 protein [Pyrenophora tritici-repentis]
MSTGVLLQVQIARSTNAWFEGTNVHIFESIILNVGAEWVLPKHQVLVTIEDETTSTKTVLPARIKRLRPGDEARVRIGVTSPAVKGARTTTLIISGTNIPSTHYAFDAQTQERQVSINNRCGIEGDFDTATYATLQRNRKWERTVSLDPFSYGYNRATPDDAYMKPQVIVTRLIEAVSMNGNFLLNVGPTAEGIIPTIQQHNLRVTGA